MTKKALWILFATMAIIIGLYPMLYFFLDKKFALLSTKDNLLIAWMVVKRIEKREIINTN